MTLSFLLDNYIGVEGAQHLAAALQHVPNLQHVNLSGTNNVVAVQHVFLRMLCASVEVGPTATVRLRLMLACCCAEWDDHADD
jgi:Ran GTPase-activating protein (RanGAP) involved in mRNA processing and transport